MSDLDLNSIPQTAGEAEALIEGFQAPEVETAAPAEAAPEAQQFKINYKGKDETYPLEKLIEFAQQGRDYSEKMAGFKAERTKFENEQRQIAAKKAEWSELEQKFARYSEVEEYLKKDPAWWDHVQKSYAEKKNLGQPQGGNAPPDPQLKALLEQELAPYREFMSSVAKEREIAQQQSEDKALDTTVSEYRSKHSQLDWTTVDENGHDLEKRILDHAIKNGLNKPEHFTIAANDYLHEEFLKRAGESAKTEVGEHIRKVNKLGLGPITDSPTIKIKRAENVRSKSWDEIGDEAKGVLGLQ